jgi:hypothetical protein
MSLKIYYYGRRQPVFVKYIDEVELVVNWLILKREGRECGRYTLDGLQGWELDEV